MKAGAFYTIDSPSRASNAYIRGLHNDIRDLNSDAMLASSGCMTQTINMSNVATTVAETSATNLLTL